MRSVGYFTSSDRAVLQKAAYLAERLTQRYFGLGPDVWERNPYALYTRKEVGKTLYDDDAFANIVRIEPPQRYQSKQAANPKYGVVLHDPNILLALLRPIRHDLWELGLFVLTHELIHIVRFREFNVDFFASAAGRDEEERIVHKMTRDVLSGITTIEHVLELYGLRREDASSDQVHGGGRNAHI
jgi:hypothetical protein